MKDKIYEIGKKFYVTEKEINAVKNSGASPRKEKLTWILSGLISAIAFVVGFFTGRSTQPTQPTSQGGYPFATGLITSTGWRYRVIWARILLIILPIITFLLGTLVGLQIDPSPYPASIRYGVYRKEDG